MGVGPLVISFYLITFLKTLSPIQSHSQVLGVGFPHMDLGDTQFSPLQMPA